MFAFILLIPAILAYVLKEQAMWITFGIEAIMCFIITLIVRSKTTTTGMKQYHGAIAMALVWTIVSLIASIPFRVNGLSWIDSLFEAFSGWTDTGASMIPNPETLPYSLGLFRAMSQWLSGLGLVVLLLSLGGSSPAVMRRLFESEGRHEDFNTSTWKIGRTIVIIYFGYTLAGVLGMWATGVPIFHAITHTMTSLSTGGFSSNSIGIGIYGAMPTIISILLMIAGGISFSSHQALFTGNFKKFIENPEVRAFALILVVSSALGLLQMQLAHISLKENALNTVFYVVSAASTTGAHTTLDLPGTPDVFRFMLTALMGIGASYGSATGGLKLWRLIILGKIIYREVRAPFYPSGTILPIRMGHNVIREDIVSKVAGYTMLYITVAMIGSLIFMMFGHTAIDSLFTVFSSQGNVGLTGMTAAMNFGMHPFLKLVLISHMLIGRMEIFPLLYIIVALRAKNP